MADSVSQDGPNPEGAADVPTASSTVGPKPEEDPGFGEVPQDRRDSQGNLLVSSGSLDSLNPTLSDPFNIQASQEKTRSRIAIFLLTLLGVTVAFTFMYVWLGDLSKPGAKELVTLVVTSVFTLIGTALGFYFGTKPGS